MRFRYVDVKQVLFDCVKYRRYQYWNLIDKFMASGKPAVEIVFDDTDDIRMESMRSSLSRAIKRINANCIAISRKGHLYLVRREYFENADN